MKVHTSFSYTWDKKKNWRTQVFSSTATWNAGDLINVNGQAAIFINVTSHDRALGSNWVNESMFITLADETGIKEVSAEEFISISDNFQTITKINDLYD